MVELDHLLEQHRFAADVLERVRPVEHDIGRRGNISATGRGELGVRGQVLDRGKQFFGP